MSKLCILQTCKRRQLEIIQIYFWVLHICFMGFPENELVKNLPARQETLV